MCDVLDDCSHAARLHCEAEHQSIRVSFNIRYCSRNLLMILDLSRAVSSTILVYHKGASVSLLGCNLGHRDVY